MRKLLIAAVLATMLVLGAAGYAIGSIPNGPAFSVCVAEGVPSADKPMKALDKAQGGCPFGWTEHTLTAVN